MLEVPPPQLTIDLRHDTVPLIFDGIMLFFYFSGASGNLSITYFPLATDMIGTYRCQQLTA